MMFSEKYVQPKPVMTPCPSASQKVNMKRRRDLYDADYKTSSKKWCRHPLHIGVMKPESKKNAIRKLRKRESFDYSDKTVDVLYSIFENDPRRVKEILQEAPPNIRKNWCNCTILHLAVENELIEMVKILGDFVNPNAVNRYSQTPAHIAAMIGNVEILKILLACDELNPKKTDVWHKTYKEWLAAPLFMAVLWSDANHIEELLKLGANPDGHAGKFADGVMATELKVSTPRQLAIAMKKDSIVERFREPMCDPPRVMKELSVNHRVSANKCRIEVTTKGFVSIFSYSSFKGRQDLTLEASNKNANNLAKVFSEMGYNGDIHSSLTAEETKEVLTEVRDMEMLSDMGCAIFYFLSHSGNEEESFLTSDMKLLTVQSVLEIFKDSKCPHLKNKPKIFIFDVYNMQDEDANFPFFESLERENGDALLDYVTKSKGLLQDTICIYSNTNEDFSYSFALDGSVFNEALCGALSHHGQRMEFSLLYKEVMEELKRGYNDNKSHVLNYDFTKEFYFSDK